jgi:hypothetical protein
MYRALVACSPITSTLPSSRVILYTPDLCKIKHTSTEHFVADKLVVGLKVLPSAGAWVIDLTAKFTPPSGATFLFRPLITPQRFCDRRVGHTILDRSKTREILMRNKDTGLSSFWVSLLYCLSQIPRHCTCLIISNIHNLSLSQMNQCLTD